MFIETPEILVSPFNTLPSNINESDGAKPDATMLGELLPIMTANNNLHSIE